MVSGQECRQKAVEGSQQTAEKRVERCCLPDNRTWFMLFKTRVVKFKFETLKSSSEFRNLYKKGKHIDTVYFKLIINVIDDFSNIPGQFRLRGKIYRILADNGLNTPMARLFSLPMLLAMLCLLCHLILAVIWLITALFQRRKKEIVTNSVKWARRLTVVAVLVNMIMIVFTGMTFGQNIFQMLFGFSIEVKYLFFIKMSFLQILTR